MRDEARRSLAFRKRTQPLALPSAGCVFQNPDPARVRLPEGMPASAGALVDAAGLKGQACGAARVSPVHANFVVNEGGASARDVASLIERMRAAVAERFGVDARGGDRAPGGVRLMAALVVEGGRPLRGRRHRGGQQERGAADPGRRAC